MARNIEGAIGVGLCGLLALGCVATMIHEGVANSRSKEEIKSIQNQAKQDKAAAIEVAVKEDHARYKAAKNAAKATDKAIRKAKADIKKYTKLNAAVIAIYEAKQKAMTKNGVQLLLDERIDLPQLVEAVLKDALKTVNGFRKITVVRTDVGFEVTLTFNKSLTWSEKTATAGALEKVSATIDPKWVSKLRFEKPDAQPVVMGSLEDLDSKRLLGFMTVYYGTKAGKLPPPEVISRRNHAHAAWRIKNGTSRKLSVDYYGPEQGTTYLEANKEKELALEPGPYYITVKVADVGSDVTPYTGQIELKGGYLAFSGWVIKTTGPFGDFSFPLNRPR